MVAEAERAAPTGDASVAPTLARATDEFLESLAGKSPRTVKTYATCLRRFAAPQFFAWISSGTGLTADVALVSFHDTL